MYPPHIQSADLKKTGTVYMHLLPQRIQVQKIIIKSDYRQEVSAKKILNFCIAVSARKGDVQGKGIKKGFLYPEYKDNQINKEKFN